MMNCTILTAGELAKDRDAMLWIADRLSRHGSDLQEKLRYWLSGHMPQQADGMIADIHGSAEYRAHLVGVMTKRAVTAALGK